MPVLFFTCRYFLSCQAVGAMSMLGVTTSGIDAGTTSPAPPEEPEPSVGERTTGGNCITVPPPGGEAGGVLSPGGSVLPGGVVGGGVLPGGVLSPGGVLHGGVLSPGGVLHGGVLSPGGVLHGGVVSPGGGTFPGGGGGGILPGGGGGILPGGGGGILPGEGGSPDGGVFGGIFGFGGGTVGILGTCGGGIYAVEGGGIFPVGDGLWSVGPSPGWRAIGASGSGFTGLGVTFVGSVAWGLDAGFGTGLGLGAGFMLLVIECEDGECAGLAGRGLAAPSRAVTKAAAVTAAMNKSFFTIVSSGGFLQAARAGDVPDFPPSTSHGPARRICDSDFFHATKDDYNQPHEPGGDEPAPEPDFDRLDNAPASACGA